jgi:hypothetical protein
MADDGELVEIGLGFGVNLEPGQRRLDALDGLAAHQREAGLAGILLEAWIDDDVALAHQVVDPAAVILWRDGARQMHEDDNRTGLWRSPRGPEHEGLGASLAIGLLHHLLDLVIRSSRPRLGLRGRCGRHRRPRKGKRQRQGEERHPAKKRGRESHGGTLAKRLSLRNVKKAPPGARPRRRQDFRRGLPAKPMAYSSRPRWHPIAAAHLRCHPLRCHPRRTERSRFAGGRDAGDCVRLASPARG